MEVLNLQSTHETSSGSMEHPALNHSVTRNFKRVHRLNKLRTDIAFRTRRIRTNAVYLLLVTSIAFTLLGTIVTGFELSKKSNPINTVLQERGLLPQEGYEFRLIRFSTFILLGITYSFALITLVKRDKSNARLLSRLKDNNRNLEGQVSKRTRQLADAIRARDHFMGVAAHDLKTPLNGIEGLTELIKVEGNLSENQFQYLEHIQSSIKKIKRLIRDILDINRIDQGKTVMDWQQVNIMELLGQIQISFEALAKSKGIDFKIEGIDSSIETDSDSLFRILENLLSNAIKFSEVGAEVSLCVSLTQDHIVFEVSDQGPGIPKEDQPKLFNKFQRLSNRPTNSETSTGLGLSIVLELTKQLGGDITFSSEVGKGSIFSVTLPQFHRIGNSTKIDTRYRSLAKS